MQLQNEAVFRDLRILVSELVVEALLVRESAKTRIGMRTELRTDRARARHASCIRCG